MNPHIGFAPKDNALASNADDVMNQLQQGTAAMGVLWASRASRMDDPLPPRWWARCSSLRREATFQVLMEALSEDAVRAGNDLAIWVRSAYVPGRFGTGVAIAQKAGAPVWPGEPFFGLAHGEIGKVLPEALTGARTPQAALDFAAAAYSQAAAEKGFIKAGA